LLTITQFGKILAINLPRRTDRRDALLLAAAYTNLTLTWVDGVAGSEVPDVTLPLRPDQVPSGDASKGCWRAHLNALASVVESNLASALIIEDDADFDIRIRQQLSDFAAATRALTQPLASSEDESERIYADPSYLHPESEQQVTELRFETREETIPPRVSPYGDDWDVLWLGHCGMAIPLTGTHTHARGRVVHTADDTVPSRHHVSTDGGPATLVYEYSDHTRLTHHVHVPVCSVAYAVSQRGARRILYELSVRNYTSEFDNMLREMCDGEEMRSVKLTCLTTQPALFTHWWPRGSRKKESDIDGTREGWRDVGESKNIRWSVRTNMEKLIKGETGDWVDQWPD
jgi:GR25 family glycosyltransferase involved in LPS biosynthesis